MIEWLDGYWTAMKHVANAVPQVTDNNTSFTDWLSALGTLGAAFYAARAATIASKSLSKSEEYQANAEHRQLILYTDQVQTRKTEIVREGNLLNIELEGKALSSKIAQTEMTRERQKITSDLDQWDKITEEIGKSSELYRTIAKKSNIAKTLNDHSSITPLEAIRTELLTIRLEAFSVDASRTGQDYRAELIRNKQAVNNIQNS